VSKSEETVIKKHLQKQKKRQFEGWDLSVLARSIEARALMAGRIQVIEGQLSMTTKIMPRPVLSVYVPPVMLNAFQNVWQKYQSTSTTARTVDTRQCALCHIGADTMVQGRLLYVELGVWAHVNCICWSYGVYENTRAKKLGKYGMLCNVHRVIREAGTCLCDFCGCPGATVSCTGPGCTTACHFACAQVMEYAFFPENCVFCEKCKTLPCAEDKLRGGATAMPPWQLIKTTARHLRVMPKQNPSGTADKAIKLPGG
jgi:hypothetical protein